MLDTLFISEKQKTIFANFFQIADAKLITTLNSFIQSEEFPLPNIAIWQNVYGNSNFTYNKHLHRLRFETITSVNEPCGFYATDFKFGYTPYLKSKGYFTCRIVPFFCSEQQKEKLYNLALKLGFNNFNDALTEYAQMYFIVQFIIATMPLIVEKKTKKITETIVTGKGKNKKNKSVVKIQNVFSLKEDFKITKSSVKKMIKCPAWGVRGHQRHLKSGAIVFVKPYVKGKYRNDPTKYVDKKYQL